jgi:hypothetical protein
LTARLNFHQETLGAVKQIYFFKEQFSLKVFKIIFKNFIERGKITKSFPKTFPLLFPGWGLPGLGFPEAVEWRSD